MKLSQHIAKMQALYAQYGDIDMACTTGGPTMDADNEAMEERHISIVETEISLPVGITSAPFILIGWDAPSNDFIAWVERKS